MNDTKELIKNGKRVEAHNYRKKAIKSGKMLLKVSKKVPQHRTESYRLKGVYYHLIGKQRKALKWWIKAIDEGERLGARLELSRTYLEVGKSLLDWQTKYKTVNGIGSEEYLEKARVLLEEMDVKWDLDELYEAADGSRMRVSQIM